MYPFAHALTCFVVIDWCVNFTFSWQQPGKGPVPFQRPFPVTINDPHGISELPLFGSSLRPKSHGTKGTAAAAVGPNIWHRMV